MVTRNERTKKLFKERDGRWCEVSITLTADNSRLSISGSEGSVQTYQTAKNEALAYWQSYFEEDRANLAQFALDHGKRTARSAAKYVLEVDGMFHGLDVHKTTASKVYQTESCGQIKETIAEWFPEVQPYLQYHLNDMHAGTERQDAELAKHTFDRSAYGSDHYKWACEVLAAAGLLDDDQLMVKVDVTPKGMLYGLKKYKLVPYRYGSQWLRRELPGTVIVWFNTLVSSEVSNA